MCASETTCTGRSAVWLVGWLVGCSVARYTCATSRPTLPDKHTPLIHSPPPIGCAQTFILFSSFHSLNQSILINRATKNIPRVEKKLIYIYFCGMFTVDNCMHSDFATYFQQAACRQPPLVTLTGWLAGFFWLATPCNPFAWPKRK